MGIHAETLKTAAVKSWAFLSVFLSFRIFEALFAVLVLMVLFTLEGTTSIGGSIWEALSKNFDAAVAVALAYDLVFLYAPFSLLGFLFVATIWGLQEKNISYANTVPYVVHALPFLLEFGSGELGYILWIAWGLIACFNFILPKILKIH